MTAPRRPRHARSKTDQMDRTQLLQFIGSTCHALYDVAKSHDHEIAPMLFAEMPRGLHVGVLAIPKEAIRGVFEQQVRDGAVTVGWLNEAWLTSSRFEITDSPEIKRAQAQALMERIKAAGGISKLPPDDRREHLVIATADRGGCCVATREIHRRQGAPITLGPLQVSQGPSAMSLTVLTDLPWTPR